MSFFLEIWIQDPVKDQLRNMSPEDSDNYYPHVTIIRPFAPKNDEEVVRRIVVDYCRGKSPIPFSLEGKNKFGDINYIPIVGIDQLRQFNNELEVLLEPHVNFVKKLDEVKRFHATIGVGGDILPFPRTNLFMLRLTCLKDKKIWFSYDFVTQEVLNREESLDKTRWNQTVKQFTHGMF